MSGPKPNDKSPGQLVGWNESAGELLSQQWPATAPGAVALAGSRVVGGRGHVAGAGLQNAGVDIQLAAGGASWAHKNTLRSLRKDFLFIAPE